MPFLSSVLWLIAKMIQQNISTLHLVTVKGTLEIWYFSCVIRKVAAIIKSPPTAAWKISRWVMPHHICLCKKILSRVYLCSILDRRPKYSVGVSINRGVSLLQIIPHVTLLADNEKARSFGLLGLWRQQHTNNEWTHLRFGESKFNRHRDCCYSY